MKTTVLIWFNADSIPGGADAILGSCKCGHDVAEVKEYEYGKEDQVSVKVKIRLDENDERVAKVLALLVPHGEGDWVVREDVYTEEELQNAPLLYVPLWPRDVAAAGPHYGTTYDFSNACKCCATGARQTSSLVIAGEDERCIEKLHVAASNYDHLLVRDVDGEKLANAKLTGLNLWPIYSLRKGGTKVELRREQVFAENVMPSMSPASLLDRSRVCSVCHRGRFDFVSGYPARLVYRAQDLANIQDFNLTWECFGGYADSPEEAFDGRWPTPLTLVTPKVMNLLRGKTKKEQKYQGCDFIPIWIEGEKR